MTNQSETNSFRPYGLPLLVGSLPHEDHQEATRLVLQHTPQIPLWVQLPHFKQEGMLYQFLSGVPGLTQKGVDYYINTQTDDFESELLAFYEAIMAFSENQVQEKDLDGFRSALDDKRAPGFSLFLELVRQQTETPVALKGQVTGPITMGTGVKDQHDRLLFYDDCMRDVVIKQVAANAAWQVRKFLTVKTLQKPIIFFDEPGVVGFGSSAYIGISREQIHEAFAECISSVQGNGGLAGIHICANGDWSLALETQTDIINFDAYSFFDRLILYEDYLKKFMDRGGLLAWGIVPTSNPELVEKASKEQLVTMWEEQLTQLSAAIKMDKELIVSQTLITPSCGTGSLNIENATKVLELTRDVSAIVRERYAS